jgi:hypothetical protein
MHLLVIGITITASLIIIIVPLLAKSPIENMRNAHENHENMEWLNQYGKRLMATVAHVQISQDWKDVDGWYRDPWDGTSKQKKTWQTYYEIITQWIDPRTKQVYRFRSKPWSDDVTRKPVEGNTVQVIVDPHNPRRYIIDFQSLS